MLQQTITLVVIRNPFTLEREIMKVPYLTIQTAVGYTKHLGFEDELVYSINGKLLEKPEESYLQPDDYLVVCPVVGKGGGGKNPLQVVAGIALSVVTMGVGGLAGAGMWGAAMTSWTAWGYLAAAATMYIGGQLLSSAFGWDIPDMSFTDSSSSTTYSWNDPTINTKQGGAVPLTYGTVKVTNPTILSQHTTTDGTNQYYNLLLCGGEGPVDSISDIRINDNPITNFQNVVVETRLGTNDQTCMTNFADTFSDQNVDYELDESYWSTLLLDGNNGQAIEVTLDAKGGLYTLDNNGKYTTATVTVNIQYRKYGTADWLKYGTYTLSGATSSSVRGVYRLDGLQPAQYEVRMQITSRSAAKTSTKSMVRVWCSMASLIVYDDFTRPGKVLVGIKALATSQLSGSLFSVTWLQTRNTVNVWNPNTSQYEQKPATNPAWACYDMLHLCKYLKDVNTGIYGYYSYGADKELFMWQRFKDWADYCDTYKLTVNILISDLKKLFAALEPIEACGRGKVLMQGTKFSCVCDAPATPVQMFGMGNIYMDSFQEDFLSLDNRANSVEVTYNNKDKNYQRDSFIAYADDYDTSDAVDNPTQITLNGKTSYEEAYREAKYKLRCNRYLIRTCSFDVDVDAIACQLGDVILLSHDVPQWGFSGRLEGATATTLTLGRDVTLEVGKTYGVYVRLQNDSIVYKTIQAVRSTTTTNVVTVTTAFSSVPQADDLFTFGEINKEAKPFRVANISRSQEMRRKISCLEYNENVYNENYNVPELQYSSLLSPIFDVTNIKLNQETYKQKDGTNVSVIYVSWDVPRNRKANSFIVYYSSDDGKTWNNYGTVTNTRVDISGVKALNTYKVKIVTVNLLGQKSQGVVSNSIYVTGKDTPPNDVPGLQVVVDTTDMTRAIATWNPVTDVDLAGYRVRVNGDVVFPLVKNTQAFYTSALNNGNYTFSVTAVDNAGNESAVAATASCYLTVYPSTVKNFNAIQNGEEVLLIWDKNPETDIIGYEIRQGGTFDSGVLVVSRNVDTTFRIPVSAETTYRYHIKAVNYAGNYSETAATDDVTVTGLLPKNVVATYNEIALQTGTKDQVAFGQSNATFQSVPCKFSDYPNTRFDEFGSQTVLTLAKNGNVFYSSGVYTAVRKDMGSIITANVGLYYTSPNILLFNGLSAKVEFRTSLDGNVFTAWKNFSPAKLTFQFFDLRVVLATTDTSVAPEVGNLTLTLDMDDVETAGIATVPVGGATIYYGRMYNVKPVFIPTAEGAGLDVDTISVGLSSAVVKVVNAVTRVDVGGTCHWRTKGY